VLLAIIARCCKQQLVCLCDFVCRPDGGLHVLVFEGSVSYSDGDKFPFHLTVNAVVIREMCV
jgi:hypothetical protein